MNARSVIIRPVISEKSYELLSAGKYTFRIHPRAGKVQVRHAIEQLFGVRVHHVRTVSVKSKPKRRGWTAGRTREWKKAIVQLHPEDSIELFEGEQVS